MKSLFTLALLVLVLVCSGLKAPLRIESVTRKVVLRDQNVKNSIIMTMKNIEKSGGDNLKSFTYSIQKDLFPKLTLISFSLAGRSEELQYKLVETNENSAIYEVQLGVVLPVDEKIQLKIEENYYNRMDPLPKKITLSEDQLVEFYDSSLMWSPYEVVSQRTIYETGSTALSHTDDKQAKKTGGRIEYGPYTNTPAYSKNQVRLHFENNTPFVVFKNVNMTIEVSHWGNIAIEGFYKLSNEGAKLTGEYGRVDYSPYKPNSGKNALKNLKAELPFHSWGVYYRDEVGNISTSNAFRDYQSKDVKIEVRPRFPIFGGWKSNWWLGYNLPVHHYVFTKDDQPENYVLKQFFGFPFENVLAEQYQLKVILPEGAENIKSNIPFNIDEELFDKTYSYLDSIGRPTIIYRKKFVSSHHYRQFQVNYTFKEYNILFEPVIIFATYVLFFLLLIVVNRVEFKSLKVSHN